jgi:hypothetical protein
MRAENAHLTLAKPGQRIVQLLHTPAHANLRPEE